MSSIDSSLELLFTPTNSIDADTLRSEAYQDAYLSLGKATLVGTGAGLASAASGALTFGGLGIYHGLKGNFTDSTMLGKLATMHMETPRITKYAEVATCLGIAVASLGLLSMQKFKEFPLPEFKKK